MKEHHEVLYLKFQFWVLKLMNRSIASTGDFSPASPISKEELSQSLETLQKLIDGGIEESRKIFHLKIAYELGYYYYLNDEIDMMKKYFTICIVNCDEEGERSLYFTKANLEKLLAIIADEGNENLLPENDIEMTVASDTVGLFNVQAKENDFQSLFQKTQLDKADKAIIEVN
jgi:hypothetical protein